MCAFCQISNKIICLFTWLICNEYENLLFIVILDISCGFHLFLRILATLFSICFGVVRQACFDSLAVPSPIFTVHIVGCVWPVWFGHGQTGLIIFCVFYFENSVGLSLSLSFSLWDRRCHLFACVYARANNILLVKRTGRQADTTNGQQNRFRCVCVMYYFIMDIKYD